MNSCARALGLSSSEACRSLTVAPSCLPKSRGKWSGGFIHLALSLGGTDGFAVSCTSGRRRWCARLTNPPSIEVLVTEKRTLGVQSVLVSRPGVSLARPVRLECSTHPLNPQGEHARRCPPNEHRHRTAPPYHLGAPSRTLGRALTAEGRDAPTAARRSEPVRRSTRGSPRRTVDQGPRPGTNDRSLTSSDGH
jgi:hypothetical protein